MLFVFVVCRILHLGGFGSMVNTPMGYADDLLTFLELEKHAWSRSATNAKFTIWFLFVFGARHLYKYPAKSKHRNIQK